VHGNELIICAGLSYKQFNSVKKIIGTLKVYVPIL